jgi:hypothetical protein
MNVRKYRRGNQKWTIQRNWQQDEEKQNKNTAQYVLDTTMRKQTQIRHEPYYKQQEVKTNRTSQGSRLTIVR